MELVRFLFGSGWWVLWHVTMWLAALLLVVLPIKLLGGDALKTPVPTPSLGTLGLMIMPVFYFLAITAINAAVAMRIFDTTALGRAGLLFATASAAVAVMVAGFWVMLQWPGRTSVAAVWMAAAVLLGFNLWLARASATRENSSILVPGGMLTTALLVVIGLPSAILLALFIVGLVSGD